MERKLGVAAARLYAEVGELVETAARAGGQASAARLALAKIGLQILCGAYHDFRTSSSGPKDDLIAALRAVPRHESISAAVDGLVDAVLWGEYDDGADEARRYVARVTPSVRAVAQRHPSVVPEPISLGEKEWRCFAWLHRYIEVYRKSPLLREMAVGLGITTSAVSEILARLERKGAVAHVGGRRGWITVRSP